MDTTQSIDAADQPPADPAGQPRPAGRARSRRPLTVAGMAAIGAGAIHAVAAGAHSEHSQAVLAFVALAVAQIAWGASALRAGDRATAAAGAAISVAAVAGWVAAKTVGIGAIEGMGSAEAVQTADAIAVGLAVVTLLACGARLLDLAVLPQLGPLVVTAVVAVALPGMVAAGSHSHGEHGHGEGDDHAHDDGHDHDGSELAAAAGDEDHLHEAAVVPPTPYDPDLPLNLSGVEGVTPEQQAQAEQLIAVTLYRLPKYADPAVAEADGFRSIGDGFTGYEHYINWDYLNDDKVLDPDYPESLVYQVIDGEKTLVAAMYMLADDDTLDTVPDVGGPLTQWHIHNDLCFTPDPEAPRVLGVVRPDGTCADPLVLGPQNPMIHVWIVPHECGPFAALEGIAGGQVPEGEERLCDHVHGSAS